MPVPTSTTPLREHQQISAWRKSSYSYYEACVTVAALPGGVGVRDSKDPDAGTLVLSRQQFAGWLAGIREDEFDDLAWAEGCARQLERGHRPSRLNQSHQRDPRKQGHADASDYQM